MTVKTKKKALWMQSYPGSNEDCEPLVVFATTKKALEDPKERVRNGYSLCIAQFLEVFGFAPEEPLKITLEWKEPA